MINRDSANNQSYVTDVKFLDVEKRCGPEPKHYVYVIQVTWTNPENIFVIYRRYAQFFDLQCQLLDLFGEAPSPSNNFNTKQRLLPFLPGKIFLGRSQIRQVALERKHNLSVYCRALITLPESISRSRPVLNFFQPLPTDVQNAAELISNNVNLVTNNSTDISGPLKLPTYRCLHNFAAQDKTEMSLRRDTLVQVVQRHLNGWWFARKDDQTGFVPGEFLRSNSHQQSDKEETQTPIKSLNEPYVVKETYNAESRDEISLTRGSFVTVIEKSYNGRWLVEFNKTAGYFPAVYLISCQGRRLPERIGEVSTNSSNPLMKRITSLTDYEQADNNPTPDKVEPDIYYVHTDYHDEMGDCVSLQRGDMVEIHQQHSSGWWLGRRVKDDFILKWLPSAFLQKEPIIDAAHISETPYLNIIAEEPPKLKARKPKGSVYQNITSQHSSPVVYTEAVRKKQPIARPVASVPVVPLANSNEQEPTKIPVRDLIKRFNRQ